MLKPFPFPDNSERLFGRKKDVAYLLERVRKPGITFITARPRMGKTWLLLEVGRQLAESDDCLVGYFEAKGGTELIQRAVIDLYLRWISTTSFSQQAKVLWEKNRGSILRRVVEALGSAFEKISKVSPRGINKIAGLFADGLSSLAVAQKDLETGKMQYEPLPYEIVRDALFLVDKIDNKNRKLVLILDAWDQSDVIPNEKRTLEAIAKHTEEAEVWSCCHILVGVRHPELDDQGANPAYKATGQISKYDTAKPYELKPMEMDEHERQKRFNLQDKIPLLKDLSLERIEELHHGYPGIIERWRKRADEISSEEDLQRLAHEAWALEYSELDKLLPPLEGDELLWAIRIAFFRRLNNDSWKIYRDILCDGIDDSLWKKLFRIGVFEWEIEEHPAGAEYYPTYGHETRHRCARLWFLKRHTDFGPNINEEITTLCFALAAKVLKIDIASFPFGIALLEYLSEELRPVVSEEAYALAYSGAIPFGISLKYYDLRSIITSIVKRDPRTQALLSFALLARGVAFGEQGDSEASISDFTKLLEMTEAPAEQRAYAYYNRGVTYGQQGDNEAAIADYTKVIEMTEIPAEVRIYAYFNRGVNYSRQGNSEAARKDFTDLFEMPETFPELRADAYHNRGVSHGKQGNREAELADYTIIIEMPDVPAKHRAEALLYRGATYGQQGDYKAALADFKRVIEMHEAPSEQRAIALNIRGLVYCKQGDNDSAIADYTKVIEMPEAPVKQRAGALLVRGLALIGQSNCEEGCENLRRALKLCEENGLEKLKAKIRAALKEFCQVSKVKSTKPRKHQKKGGR